ncbi:hypothetical protein AAFC00_006093 [Neodothiora populina]|uniref:Cytochrome b5 heme-binding domain-containing protein n=1 Tax=Neodothiora populina TaxID=2781224 RepID=A0ABR3P6Y0_9PEZI
MEQYTLAEVASRNTEISVLIAIESKVYNITDFLEDHPGGKDILLEVGGKDATEEFEEAAHSDEARTILKQYLVAKLKDDRVSPKASKSTEAKNQRAELEHEKETSTVKAKKEIPPAAVLIGVTSAAAAVILRKTEYLSLFATKVTVFLAQLPEWIGGLRINPETATIYLDSARTSSAGLLAICLAGLTISMLYWALSLTYIEFGYGKYPSVIRSKGRRGQTHLFRHP